MLDIPGLVVSQEVIREKNQIRPMINFVKAGGLWTSGALFDYARQHGKAVSPLVQVTRFPDGMLMVHDGHHRALSTLLAGRKKFYNDEVQVTDWTYEAYLEINFDLRWVTPFDPRTEVRLADFFGFKGEAMDLYGRLGAEKAVEFIMGNRDRFCHDRTIMTVEDMAAGMYSVPTEG